MLDVQLIPQREFRRVEAAAIDSHRRLALLADMCRFNTLSAVKRAGSGHLGTSFSAMDLVTWLYYREMNVRRLGVEDPDRDVYFSSKGHDVPGLYALLCSLEILPEEKLLALRRFGGLDGHPDVGVRGIEANSGSLGMGISKGRGVAWAKRRLGRDGRVFVMLGDGELQEGQIWEAMQVTAHHREGNLTVIVDHNKVQSDKLVAEIVDLGALEEKCRAFGWHVVRGDGHDFAAIERSFAALGAVRDRPKLFVADTIKGRGVSFMEHPAALEAGKGLYRWHAGAPDDASFQSAAAELLRRLEAALREHGLGKLATRDVTPNDRDASNSLVFQNSMGEPVSLAARERLVSGVSDEYVAEAYGQALVDLAGTVPELVVLDADLSADCRLRKFEQAFPERFIEVGIAEQDMVSMAAGLARHGLLPVVNSFASFLAARANEQIYNALSERNRIILACHYAGLIPAGPGKSHQSIRDISLLGALPDLEIIQPANAVETRQAVAWAVERATGACALRLVIGPSPRKISLPAGYRLAPGRGVELAPGADALLFAYGPVMLNEALTARELLSQCSIGLSVVNLPWLNRVDREWLRAIVAPYEQIFVVEDHAPAGGLADHLLAQMMDADLLQGRRVARFAVEGMPACGTPMQALAYHGLDGTSLSERVRRALAGRRAAADRRAADRA